MDVPNNTPAPNAANAATTAAQTTAETSHAPVETPADTGTEETLGEAGKAALTAERAARKKADRALADANRKLQAIEDANKSELELAVERAAKAEQAATDAMSKLAVYRNQTVLMKAAADAGAVDTDVVWALIGSAIETDIDGNPTNIELLLGTLAANKPHLFNTGNPGGFSPLFPAAKPAPVPVTDPVAAAIHAATF